MPNQKPHLVSFTIDPIALMSLAAARKTIPPSGDLGYAIHQVLTETFGKAAPKPFHLFEEASCALLAYSCYTPEELIGLALQQKPNVLGWELSSAALNFPAMEGAVLPAPWPRGKRYRFTVRTRPVMRTSHAKERRLPRECDVFLHAVASKEKEAWLDRQAVYLSWFEKQAANAGAKIGGVRVTRMTRRQVYRKGAPSLDGPDVTFTGALEISDPEAFDDFVMRGVGRHRAFGYGMLLLRTDSP